MTRMVMKVEEGNIELDTLFVYINLTLLGFYETTLLKGYSLHPAEYAEWRGIRDSGAY
jgi:hypothetical protein